MKRPQVLYNTGWAELNKGNLDLAMGVADRGLQLYPSADREWHWRFRVLKAEILVWQHLDKESLDLNRAELPPKLATSDLAVWRRLSQSVASAYTQQPASAHRYLDEAETLAKAYHPELLGQVALRRGTVLFWDGALADAQIVYQRALQLARAEKNPFLEAAALGSLGVTAARLEHYDESVDWNRAALELSQSIGAQSSRARILGNMGWCYRELGDYDTALLDYREAEAAAAQNGQIGDELYWRTGIASVHTLQGNYRSAEEVLKQALNQARRQDDKSIATEYLNDLSEIAVQTGRLDLAESYLEEVSEIEKGSTDHTEVPTSQLIRGRIWASRGDYAKAKECFGRVILDPKADSSQKWEGEARLAKVYAEEGRGAKAEKEFRRALDTVEVARSSVKSEELRMSFLSSAVAFYEDYIEFLIAQGRTEDALQVAELSRARTLAEGLGTTPNTRAFSPRNFRPQEIARRFQSVLLFYWIGEGQSHLWVITPAKISCFLLPKRSEVEPKVQAYRRSILNGQDALTAERETGKDLYQILIAPAGDLIPRNSRVILLAAESLYNLNFETLIVPKPHPHYWIEDVTLSEAGSLTLLLAASREVNNARKNLLLVGDPAPPSNEFPSLVQAPAEMAKVSQHFPRSACTVLQGKEATASAYKRINPEAYAYLHFVTHGTASHTRPLDSALILSREADSYKLYARDIITHPLKARVVTISACNGAGLRPYAGEGLVGLSWAFLRAGARHVVASLWEVSDASSTAQLMDAFYGGLDLNEDPATALRGAKLLVLHSNANTVFRKPFYWAAFQLYVGS